MENAVRDTVMAMPLVTRVLVLGTLVVTVVANWGLVDPYLLVLSPDVYLRGQVWRIVTCVFFAGPLSFQFLMNLFMLYNYSKNLEQENYVGRTADFITFVAVATLALGVRASACARGGIVRASRRCTHTYPLARAHAHTRRSRRPHSSWASPAPHSSTTTS